VWPCRETAKEMEQLRFEKKQLMLQWRSSLIGLTRRDEVGHPHVHACMHAYMPAYTHSSATHTCMAFG
jgi:hypothetical protein